MFNELLLSLLGHHGEIIVLASNPVTSEDSGELPLKYVTSFQIAKDVADVLHPGERKVLEQLICIGYRYKILRDFVESVCFYSAKKPDEVAYGIYLRSLCDGINAILEDYRKTALNIERSSAEKHEVPSLPSIQTDLHEFRIIFPHLVDVTHEIKTNKIHGVALLQFLSAKIDRCAVPEVKSALQRLFVPCNMTMFDQIASWMIHGILIDKYGEFFIGQRATSDSSRPTASSTWSSEFSLNLALVPSFISQQITEKILFVGRAVQILKRRQYQQQQLRKDTPDEKEELNLSTSDIKEFSAALHELALSNRESFHAITFEFVIEKIRKRVAECLWKLVVVDAKLIAHLKMMKDYFLVSKGDFYQAFIEDTRAVMSLPPKAFAEHDINLMFHQTATKGSKDEEFLNQINGKLTPTNEPGELVYLKGWENLSLNYKADWCLDLLLHKQVVESYNQMFRLLLTLKRVQFELQLTWAHHSHIFKHLEKDERAEVQHVMLLRSNMSFLIDNLQYYFLFFIIETSYSQMVKKIEQTTDFEAIKQIHEDFLSATTSQLFLGVRTIQRCLNEIFRLCFTFCDLTLSNDVAGNVHNAQKISQIAKEYERQTSLLFTILLEMKNHGNKLSHQLGELLLLLNIEDKQSLTKLTKALER
eukprot:TRINITY_DN5729_c0_g1_i1.p1 TRINITY_DN5729_c0_g1~~TRINITY_DN5729_c0_g1_i1.p1  ORF type:complete len:646 (+),score=176.79 TRINITY_DN5729_c0_g1_i1:125-2062(+)